MYSESSWFPSCWTLLHSHNIILSLLPPVSLLIRSIISLLYSLVPFTHFRTNGQSFPQCLH
jgi:hypothetical protein